MPDLEVVSYRPDPSEFAWTFGGVRPVRTIRPGTVLEVWTEDAFGGRVRGPDDLVSRVIEFPFVNPQSGPFYIEGAEPGDTVAVHFVSITPSRDYAASSTIPFFGALTGTGPGHTASLQDPLDERIWMYEVDRANWTVTYQASRSDFSVVLPMDPMHGTVGVAPASFEARSSLVPDAHGGNMDTPEMRAGVTCYLGVNVEGALFSLGDGHARQGEGETTPWPRLENDDYIMSTGSARPLEDAFRISQVDLVGWLAEQYGLEPLDAYQLLTQVAEAPVANVCDPNYTCVSKVRKRYLPTAAAYGGMHAQLLEQAVAYSASR